MTTLSIPPLRAPFLLAAQLTASITASALAYTLFPSSDAAAPPIASVPAAFAREALAAIPQVLAAVILARNKRRAGPSVPDALGIAVALGSIIGSGLWGGGNPTRSFGRQVVNGQGQLRTGQYWAIYCKSSFPVASACDQ
jgi:hypothetical protein